MISDKVISSLAAHFSVINEIEETEEAVYMITIVRFKNRELYRHTLDLSPLEEAFHRRLDKK